MPSSRTSRSDAGIISLTRSLLHDVMGLDNETISKMMKIIRSQGQLQDLKVNLRSLNAVAYKRLNQVIDMIEKDRKETREQKGEKEAPKDEKEQKDMKESFLGYLLNELQFDADTLRDPDKKQDIMRLARASDTQADAMTQRMERDKKREVRQDVQQEKDPRRAQLKRKKMALLNQIEKIDDQLAQEPQQ